MNVDEPPSPRLESILATSNISVTFEEEEEGQQVLSEQGSHQLFDELFGRDGREGRQGRDGEEGGEQKQEEEDEEWSMQG